MFSAIRRSSFVLLAALAPFAAELLSPTQAAAQVLQGSINGNVTDNSGAAVVDAPVMARNMETNAVRRTVTNSSGAYDLTALAPGTWELTVEAPGFQTYVKSGIPVSVNNVTRSDVALTIGTVTEQVTVQANAAYLQTDRAEVRTEVATKALESLPVPMGRDYQFLLTSVAGVTPPENANSFAANPARSIQFNVNGASRVLTTTRIDGAAGTSVKDPNLTSLYVPALEAIESVNIVTNAFDAEQGLAGGALVNVTIKSGANAFHGSVFEDHADQHLKAYAWNADHSQPKGKYINNQFGGTVGGPIRKNKLFYFISYEGTRYSENVTQAVQVPTATMKLGNLSASPTQLYDPASGTVNGAGRAPFGGNIIPVNRIDKGVQNLLNLGIWPDPNQPGTGAFGLASNFLTSAKNWQARDQFDDKLSWNLSTNQSMYYRFGYLRHNAYTYGVMGELIGLPISRANTSVGEAYGDLFQGTVSHTWVATSHLVMTSHFGFEREDPTVRQPRLNENLGWTVLQIPGLQSSNPREGSWPVMSITGFSIIGNPSGLHPEAFSDPSHSWATSINWIKGNHNIGAGADFIQQYLNEYYEPSPAQAGTFTFGQGPTQLSGGPAGNDFNAFAAFLLGYPSSAGKGSQFTEFKSRAHMYSLFLRDQWQVTPRLTLNYGTRWEYFPYPTKVGRGLEAYDFSSGNMLLCGVGSVPSDCGLGDYRGNKRFSPRVGIAYRASDSFVVRGGYGISVDPTNLSVAASLFGPFPDDSSVSLSAPNSLSYATTLRMGLPPVPQPDLTKGALPPPPLQSVFTIDKGNMVRGYIQSWNLVLEKRFGGWVTSAAYVATRSVDSLTELEQNWAPLGTGAAGQVLNARFGRTASTKTYGTLGTAKYDALQTRAEHRFANGFQIGSTYTFAKALGYTDETSLASPFVGLPSAYQKNYGPLNHDIRHNFSLNVIAESPWGKGKAWLRNGLAGRILGGWQISGLISAFSGTPFTATAAATTLNSFGSGQFADCLNPHQTGDINQWYNISGFAIPTAGRFGTCGANSLRGPSLINSDASLAHVWSLNERVQLKFRAEVFNVGNHPHHANPGLTASTSTTTANQIGTGAFMQATQIRNTGRDGIDERAVRLSLRLGW